MVTIVVSVRDLDPIEAPHWTLRARFTEETRCLMGRELQSCKSYVDSLSHLCFFYTTDECLSSFLKLGNYQQGIEEIIGQIPTTASEEGELFFLFNVLVLFSYV